MKKNKILLVLFILVYSLFFSSLQVKAVAENSGEEEDALVVLYRPAISSKTHPAENVWYI